jgi:hypothetical protein
MILRVSAQGSSVSYLVVKHFCNELVGNTGQVADEIGEKNKKRTENVPCAETVQRRVIPVSLERRNKQEQ